MEKQPLSLFALLLLLLLSSSMNAPSSLSATPPLPSLTTDQDALLALKNTITNNSTTTLAQNWSDNTSVCYWIGVTCGNKHQNMVISLNISGFALSGTLPPHLGNLTFLRYFDISSNHFTGPIPSELSRLHRLRVINMGFNSFTGEIPSWFGALPRLEQLRLRNNNFSGTIPEEIGNCTSLQILNLNYNWLTGPIPHGIFNLSSIREIWIMDNGLSGTLPSDMCNNLRNLTTLSLSGNQIEGRIPPNIWKCRELEVLSLSHNRFNGEIPSEIGSLSMLRELYLGFNNFEGPIPKQIGNCSSLLRLYLNNNLLTGSLPSKVSHFNLEELYLDSNKLSGMIPSYITNYSKLSILSLENNSFSGSMPNFGNLRFLRRLYIWGNNLNGGESSNQKLEFLSSLTHCRFLEVLQIGQNPLNGILPASVGNLSTSLRYFLAYDNNIMGVIPYTIGNLSSLMSLRLDGNRLTGFIPPTIGKLKQLQGLFLSRNRLNGYIPSDLCQLTTISELSLSDNILTGPIIECLGDVQSIRNIYLDSNKLNSTIPSNFWNLRDLLFLNLSSNYLTGRLSSRVARLKVINQLDLSHNQFSRDIPNSIDGCQSLQFLYLSNNAFEGYIPPSLGNIKGLTALDMSNNKFFGSIPPSLENLNFLQYFNVSYNNLEGEIPTKGHFINFTAQSFINNFALCGETRFQVPSCFAKNIGISRPKKFVWRMKYTLLTCDLVIILSTIIILVIMIITILVMIRRRKHKCVPSLVDISLDVTWRRTSYLELVRGTNEFSHTKLLGRGSFGSVYKAKLSDGLTAAVKVFDSHLERAVRSFDTECEVLSNVQHRNLVRVIGCCSNIEFKALVLKYFPNGSLVKWLHSENYSLDLIQRLEIATDVALALEYLHHGHTFPVVHCDIKPSNVLLDGDMVAHISDFGISKLFHDGESMVQTKTLATIGYAAPEYGSDGKVSTNGDVYSYGIILLEIFTSKKPTDDMFGEEMSLSRWVNEALQENAVSEVMAPDLQEDQHFYSNVEECVSSIFKLAMKCLAVSPKERINMIETVSYLNSIKANIMANTSRRQQYALSIIVGQ